MSWVLHVFGDKLNDLEIWNSWPYDGNGKKKSWNTKRNLDSSSCDYECILSFMDFHLLVNEIFHFYYLNIWVGLHFAQPPPKQFYCSNITGHFSAIIWEKPYSSLPIPLSSDKVTGKVFQSLAGSPGLTDRSHSGSCPSTLGHSAVGRASLIVLTYTEKPSNQKRRGRPKKVSSYAKRNAVSWCNVCVSTCFTYLEALK